MRLSPSMIARLRGPVVAAALAGCASPPSSITPDLPEPAPVEVPALVAASAPDPVPYDDASEAARLARADTDVASTEARRARRLENARRANERAGRGVAFGLGRLGRIGFSAGCGRG